MEKHIKINGIDIAIYQNSGTGLPVLFIHGNSLSAHYFQKQLDSELLQNYRLISFDLPGHGDSSKPINPEEIYSFSGLASLIKNIIDKLKLDQVVLVGHSIGGHTAIQALNKIKNIIGILVIGTPPIQIPPRFDLAFHQVKEVGYLFSPNISNEQAAEIAKAFSQDQKLQEKIKSDIIKTDPHFRAFLFKSIGEGKYQDEIVSLNQFSGLKCIALGEKDKMVNLDYIKTLNIKALWNDSIQIVKDSSHLSPHENCLEFDKLLLAFLEKCNRNIS